MKCKTCKYLCWQNETSFEYSWVWCSKGHWEGDDGSPEPEIDPWKDCIDYKDKTKTEPEGEIG